MQRVVYAAALQQIIFFTGTPIISKMMRRDLFSILDKYVLEQHRSHLSSLLLVSVIDVGLVAVPKRKLHYVHICEDLAAVIPILSTPGWSRAIRLVARGQFLSKSRVCVDELCVSSLREGVVTRVLT